jgi:hypothetical protein
MRLRPLSFCLARLRVSLAILLQGAALIFLAASAAAAPGGTLLAAISDEFDTLKPIWTPGLRGMPEFLTIHDGVLSMRSVDNGDDAYPSAEDMLCTYADQIGRSLDASERPSIVAQVWFPPFDQWPTGTNASGLREWLGLRVTAHDAGLPDNSGNYWPGIYVGNDDAGPCLIARVGDGYAPDITIGRITTAGWWTLGLSWNKDGRLECYAAPGRVTLTQADLLHTTPDQPNPDDNRSLDQVVGTFLALRMTDPATGQLSPDWMLDSVRVYVKPAAQRDFDGDGNTDVILQNTNGAVFFWVMNGSGGLVPGAGKYIYSGALPDWKVVGAADMNGDGKADVILQNTNGAVFFWVMDGSGALVHGAGKYIYNGALPDWKVVGAADMNGDGKADIILQNTNGAVFFWVMNGSGGLVQGAGKYIYSGALPDWTVR